MNGGNIREVRRTPLGDKVSTHFTVEYGHVTEHVVLETTDPTGQTGLHLVPDMGRSWPPHTVHE